MIGKKNKEMSILLVMIGKKTQRGEYVTAKAKDDIHTMLYG